MLVCLCVCLFVCLFVCVGGWIGGCVGGWIGGCYVFVCVGVLVCVYTMCGSTHYWTSVKYGSKQTVSVGLLIVEHPL